MGRALNIGRYWFLKKIITLYLIISMRLLTILLLLFWSCHVACGILVPRPWIEPMPPAMEAWHLNHWTAREILKLLTDFQLFFLVTNVEDSQPSRSCSHGFFVNKLFLMWLMTYHICVNFPFFLWLNISLCYRYYPHTWQKKLWLGKVKWFALASEWQSWHFNWGLLCRIFWS